MHISNNRIVAVCLIILKYADNFNKAGKKACGYDAKGRISDLFDLIVRNKASFFIAQRYAVYYNLA